MTPQEAIDALKASQEVMVGPTLIAAALKMKPDVLRKHVRDGEYKISKFDINRSRIRFARKDFLQQIGEIPPDPEEKTAEQILMEMLEEVKAMRAEMQRIRQCCNTDGTRKDWLDE